MRGLPTPHPPASLAGVYSIVTATNYGTVSAHTIGFGGAALALLASFVVLESRLANTLMPIRVFRLRSLTGASVVRAFLFAVMFTNFFIGALYLQHIRNFTAFNTGLAFLPSTLALGFLPAGITARLMARFGPRTLAIAGLTIIGSALLLLSGADDQSSALRRLPLVRAGCGHVAHAALDDLYVRGAGR